MGTVDRKKLFITVRDDKGNLMDPLLVTYSIKNNPRCIPERVSKGMYLVAEQAVPEPDDCVLWKIQESAGVQTQEIRQASDGGLYYDDSPKEIKRSTDFLDELDCSTGSTPGMTPLEVLRGYPTARAKFLEMVPELTKDLTIKHTISLATEYRDSLPEKYSNRKTFINKFVRWLKEKGK